MNQMRMNLMKIRAENVTLIDTLEQKQKDLCAAKIKNGVAVEEAYEQSFGFMSQLARTLASMPTDLKRTKYLKQVIECC